MSAENSKKSSEERPQPPRGIFGLALNEFRIQGEVVCVYNPWDYDLLVYNCHGLTGKLEGEVVKQNISPKKPFWGGKIEGWGLEREAVRDQEDMSLRWGVVAKHKPSNHNFAVFNNVWKFGEEGIEELLKGKSYTFITENGDLVFIPVRSKSNKGGGVMVTSVKDLNEPQTLKLITNFLESKAS